AEHHHDDEGEEAHRGGCAADGGEDRVSDGRTDHVEVTVGEAEGFDDAVDHAVTQGERGIERAHEEAVPDDLCHRSLLRRRDHGITSWPASAQPATTLRLQWVTAGRRGERSRRSP